MKKLYRISETNSLDRIEYGDYDWTEITKPSLGELAMVKKRTGLEPDTAKLILSSHESNRISGLTDLNKPLMIIMQYPVKIESKFGNYREYDTSPIICILTNDTDRNDIITLSNKEPNFIKQIQKDTQNLKVPLKNKKDVILLLIYYMAKEYNAILSLLTSDTTDIENKLKEATNNKILYHMMSIQKTIASFLDSLTDNEKICNKIINDSNYFKDEKYVQLATLASVELGEASELAKHLDYVLEKYSNLISSIVSNNQSKTINRFTKWNTLTGVVGASFGGLGINYMLPEEKSPYAFLIISGTLLIVTIILGIYIDHILKNEDK